MAGVGGGEREDGEMVDGSVDEAERELVGASRRKDD